jgi:hypothetical protein
MRVPCEALNLHGLAMAMRAVGDLSVPAKVAA